MFRVRDVELLMLGAKKILRICGTPTVGRLSSERTPRCASGWSDYI